MTTNTAAWTSTATPMLVPLTAGQRNALHDAASRRAGIMRRTARRAVGDSQVPASEQSTLVSEATAAQSVSAITAKAEALVIRRPGDARPRPRSLADLIVGEALALTDAISAGDTDDIAGTLATLAQLITDTQRELLDEDTIQMAAPAGTWRTDGRLTWPVHYRACADEGPDQ